ncbi:hypothetical protein B4U80_12865 [Leptotrombidium deliense]|uniref:Terpene synthase n=1 Tax=Leptotrombidium deliense TaxID=299467 RepID=A0A443SJ25_9ACAR|nr:hypothetical protein B4U80_12865 [Leptotrombidium deliense]
MIQWIAKHELCDGDKIDEVKSAKIEYFSARSFIRYDSVERLDIACKALVWVFLLDDILEKNPCEEIYKVLFDFIKQLKSGNCANESNKSKSNVAHRFINAYNEIWQTMCSSSPPEEWKQRLIRGMDIWVRGTQLEHKYRKKGSIISLGEFLLARWCSGAIFYTLSVMEYTHNQYCCNEARCDPVFQQIESNFYIVYYALNDVYSYRKEKIAGDNMNLVMIIINEYGVSSEKAIEIVSQLVNSGIESYECSLQILDEILPNIDRGTRHYIESLKYMLRADIDFYFDSSRYVHRKSISL